MVGRPVQFGYHSLTGPVVEPLSRTYGQKGSTTPRKAAHKPGIGAGWRLEATAERGAAWGKGAIRVRGVSGGVAAGTHQTSAQAQAASERGVDVDGRGPGAGHGGLETRPGDGRPGRREFHRGAQGGRACVSRAAPAACIGETICAGRAAVIRRAALIGRTSCAGRTVFIRRSAAIRRPASIRRAVIIRPPRPTRRSVIIGGRRGLAGSNG